MSTLFIGKDTDGVSQELLLNRANRHGLVAGATGTGKTVTLQILAEGFSKAGVPVFCADVKGDLSGISQSGSADHKLHKKLISRAQKIGLQPYTYGALPTVFWDLHGEKGHPVRTTIAEMGPMLLSRLMDLTDAQEGIMNIAFDVADNEKWPLLDLKDLKSTLTYVGESRKELALEYGNITTQSVGAIMRGLLVLEREGADKFFGEPALTLSDFMRTVQPSDNDEETPVSDEPSLSDFIKTDDTEKGIINILAADELINTPKLYATFLLWLMSELFEELPEVGDPDKPVMAFFFDEAHLLFKDAPKAMVDKITQVARLIRSKGVSLWFVTQNPTDIPDDVLSQVGNRIQHALRGYTPKEQKAIRASAESFRPNPDFKTVDVIAELGVGEALVSVLDAKGRPQVVGQTLIRPPSSRLGPATMKERKAIMANSEMAGKYDDMVDRKSAYEMLAVKREKFEKARIEAEVEKVKSPKKTQKRSSKRSARRSSSESKLETAIRVGGRMINSPIGRQITRSILGNILRR